MVLSSEWITKLWMDSTVQVQHRISIFLWTWLSFYKKINVGLFFILAHLQKLGAKVKFKTSANMCILYVILNLAFSSIALCINIIHVYYQVLKILCNIWNFLSIDIGPLMSCFIILPLGSLRDFIFNLNMFLILF